MMNGTSQQKSYNVGDIVTCRYHEKGQDKQIEVRIVTLLTEPPFEGWIYTELVNNPGVFSHFAPDDIVPS
jgi:hypothetical protein